MVRKYVRGWSIFFENRKKIIGPLFGAIGDEIFSAPPLLGVSLIALAHFLHLRRKFLMPPPLGAKKFGCSPIIRYQLRYFLIIP